MLVTFFDMKGIVHFDVITQGQTIKQAYYAEIMERLRQAVRRKRPELWPNDWIIQHHNAPTHRVLSVKKFLVQKSITEMEHPSYSPDLASKVFWMFPKINSALNDRRFQDT
jgi:hypothetical protein